MKIISFNCRGIGGGLKKRALTKLIKSEQPDIVFLQETKTQGLDVRVVRRIWEGVKVGTADASAQVVFGVVGMQITFP